MVRISKWVVPAMALGLLAGLSAMTAQAADDAKGSISGTVTGVDGKPAANVPVRVMKPHAKGEKPAAGEKPAPVAKGTTDDNGKFEIKDVPAGDYTVTAGGKKAGGNGHEKATVTAGSNVEVSITLKAPTAAAGDDTSGGKKKHGDHANKAEDAQKAEQK